MSNMANVVRRRSRAVVGVISVVLGLTSLITVTFPSTAHAGGLQCHFNGGSVIPDSLVQGDFGPTGDMKYPAVLHGHTVYLYTDPGNASAGAAAYLEPGDILTIDRSNFEVRGPRPDHNWLSTADVWARGDWDWCEAPSPWLVASWAETPRIDGAHRAVRVCLRHNGDLQCANIWYADNDDDAGDWR